MTSTIQFEETVKYRGGGLHVMWKDGFILSKHGASDSHLKLYFNITCWMKSGVVECQY